MSYKDYLNDFGKVENKIETFKEDIVNSKEFVTAFLDLTNDVDDEIKSLFFESLMGTIEITCKDNFK